VLIDYTTLATEMLYMRLQAEMRRKLHLQYIKCKRSPVFQSLLFLFL